MDFVIENNIITRCTNKGLLDLQIPHGVVAIDNCVFQNCSDLTSVELPESCRKIGDYAFDGCNNLETVIGFKNIDIIGECAFANCSSLKQITFGDKIHYLPNGTFLGCITLKKLEFPKNISYIGCECFKDCMSVEEIEMNNVMEIDNNAFENCNSVLMVAFPENLLRIAPNAFSFCDKLKNVIFKNNITNIDEKAFENTIKLIFRASQNKSTAYNFAVANKFVFIPTIIKPECREVTNQEYETLCKNGIPLKAKVADDNNMIIVFDRSFEEKVNKLIGSGTNGK